jgi:hypothetical protein
MELVTNKSHEKLKSLALILRSLAPESQRAIYKQLPEKLVRQITQVSLNIDKELTPDDWDKFTQSWPEFSFLINGVMEESKFQHCNSFKITERSKIQDYIDYKMGNKKDRPNLSSSITRIIDNFIMQHAN